MKTLTVKNILSDLSISGTEFEEQYDVFYNLCVMGYMRKSTLIKINNITSKWKLDEKTGFHIDENNEFACKKYNPEIYHDCLE